MPSPVQRPQTRTVVRFTIDAEFIGFPPDRDWLREIDEYMGKLIVEHYGAGTAVPDHQLLPTIPVPLGWAV